MLSSVNTEWTDSSSVSSSRLYNHHEESSDEMVFSCKPQTCEILWDPRRSLNLYLSAPSPKIKIHHVIFDKKYQLVRNHPIVVDVNKTECDKYFRGFRFFSG